MRKSKAIIVAMLIALMIPTSVWAEESDVWNEITVSEDSVVMEVKTTGPIADGYFEIQYDADQLSVDKEEVAFNEAINFPSVNVEDNVVVVAIVSKEPIEEGVIFSVKFKPVTAGTKLSEDMVSFYGEANDANGESLKTTNNAEKQRDVGQTAEKPVDEAKSPNNSVLIAGIVLLGAAVILAIAFVIRKKFAKKN